MFEKINIPDCIVIIGLVTVVPVVAVGRKIPPRDNRKDGRKARKS